jgi:glycogen debranching enzyme
MPDCLTSGLWGLMMHRRSVLGGLVVGATSAAAGRANPTAPGRRAGLTPVLKSLAISVTAAENRQYSYTDKVSGYFHGRTHTDENPDWFNGWNIATKRIFHDYRLSVDGASLSRIQAKTSVSPHHIQRSFRQATETLSLLDDLAVLVLQMDSVTGNKIGVTLTGDLTDGGTIGPEGVWFAPKEAVGSVLLLAPIVAAPVQLASAHSLTTTKAAGGFFFIHTATKPEALRLLANVRRNWRALLAARAQRMEALVSGNHALDAGDPDRTKALLWMRLTGDQLVTRQLGTGIYAGLPWFNDYWGRDTFISITGLLFINGQYEEAARVFESFAALQDKDPNSKTYGRVPNRARPDSIEYNSADGTPRFIITLADLVQRSGDVALAKRLWPVVRRAIEGVLKNNVDELGLITHDDADTWMDAKEKGVRAWSPRGNRAIDVQALWGGAFAAAGQIAFFAKLVRLSPAPLLPDLSNIGALEAIGSEAEIVRACTASRTKLIRALSEHFIDPASGKLVDHLKPDGSKDTKLRPNVMFAFSSIYPETGPLAGKPRALARQKMMWVKDLWERLVYPWGVATLSQDDADFYPYHEHWHYYHKDAAYHNGTVWPWLNGVAIDMLLAFNVVDPPWQLFENMNRQALKEGAVGSLAECADALLTTGANWSRRTGTFLQAWSNAEHLRVWQEGFLGLRVDAYLNQITVKSNLPNSVSNVSMSVPYKNGTLIGKWHDGSPNRWSFQLVDADADFFFNLPDYTLKSASWSLRSGQRVDIEAGERTMVLTAFDSTGAQIGENVVHSDAEMDRHRHPAIKSKSIEVSAKETRDEIFAGLDFCKPRLQPNLKSLSVYHDPPLTY